jgi:molybdopterin synthase catalytic subunit
MTAFEPGEPWIAVIEERVDVDRVRRSVSHPACGAVLVFEGVGREDFDGHRVVELSYEAWKEAAEVELRAIAGEIAIRWPGARAAIVHRTGIVAIGEASVAIAVAAPHRAACYEASRYAIDELKVRAPIWKKEIYADGSAWKANSPAS